MSIKSDIEAGLTVIARPDVATAGIGFGAPLDYAVNAQLVPRAIHFTYAWPNAEMPDSARRAEGELTEATRAEVEAHARRWIDQVRADAGEITAVAWRVEPVWARERDFERDVTSNMFHMRGSFIDYRNSPTAPEETP